MYLCQPHITIIKVGTDVSVKPRQWGIIHRLNIECVTNSLCILNMFFIIIYYQPVHTSKNGTPYNMVDHPVRNIQITIIHTIGDRIKRDYIPHHLVFRTDLSSIIIATAVKSSV